MDTIFLLQSDPRAAATLQGALAPPYRVRPVADITELERLLQGPRPVACVWDPFEPPSPKPFSSLQRIRRRHPTVALVIASDFGGREMDLYHLGRLNVDGVIRMESHPSSRDILNEVNGAIAASLATLVILRAARDLPPMVQEAIRWAIEHAEDRPQVSELAAALALSPRVLSRETRALSLASPRTLLLWGRLIRASHLLERSSETVESVAFHFGYATGGALGKALKRHVGSSPTHLLERGGLSWTLDVFGRQGLHPVSPKGGL